MWTCAHSEILSRLSQKSLALLLLESLGQGACCPVKSLHHILLLFESIVGILNAPFEQIILLASEVTGLAVDLDKLFLGLLDLLIHLHGA